MKRLILLSVFGLCLTACAQKAPEPKTAPKQAPQPAVPKSDWVYFASRNEMTDEVSRVAQTFSVDEIPAHAPYPAMRLGMIFTSPDQVWFGIEDGNFNCPPRFCFITARFDGGTPVELDVSEIGANAGLPGSMIALDDAGAKRFIAQLGKSKNVLVKVPVYGAGVPTVRFDLSGFEQAKLDAEKP